MSPKAQVAYVTRYGSSRRVAEHAASVLRDAGLVGSNSEANRKLKENAVRIDAEVVVDAQRVFQPGFEGVLQVGKRNFSRVRLVCA